MANDPRVWTQGELWELPITPPARASKYWQPISHGDLVNWLGQCANSEGMALDNQRVVVSNDSAVMAATFDMIGLPCQPPEGWVFSVGIYNSNAQTAPTLLMGGLRSADEGISFVLSEILIGKHTKRLAENLQECVNRALTRYRRQIRGYGDVLDRLAAKKLSYADMSQIITRASLIKLAAWSRIGQAATMFQATDGTALDLLTCFARINALSPPLFQLRRGYRFYQLLT